MAFSRVRQPYFTAFTAGKVALAMLSSTAMVAVGNTIVKENRIEAPAITISAESAAQTFNMYLEMSGGTLSYDIKRAVVTASVNG